MSGGGRMEPVTARLEQLPLGQKKVTLLLCWVLLCGAVGRVQKGMQSHSEGRAGGSRRIAPSGWDGRGLTGEPGPRAQTHQVSGPCR